MELVRYQVILQIRVGQDDKFDKENIYIFLKTQKGELWIFHKMDG